ncbi:hypothetical protein RND81_12G029500 [Saponaria officinalis]|uniref:3'-5' exonuclease n=1 Tax=Saponaria officinalis TaxID=3572 RepID=A0AAW1H726_SAPOF
MKTLGEKTPNLSPTSTETTIAPPKFEVIHDDWNKPLTFEELEAIDAAFDAATTTITTKSTRISSVSSSSVDDTTDETRPRTRRRLPDSIRLSNGDSGLTRSPGSFALTPCRTNSGFRQANVKLKYPAMNFGGRIVYCRTIEEVEEATLQICKLLEAKKCELGRAILGLDLEWKPSFVHGIPQGIAAVMQICGDMTHCYVLHIFHSGIPHSLQSLLEDSSSIKVGVGIDNDAVKLFHDYKVSIKSVQDLSVMANQKLGGVSKQWSLSSLVETLTCKQVLDWYLLL